MATDQEKEQLMQTLKFTPRKYKIEIFGYGGEIYWGSVDRKIYDFFKEKSIDIGQYASDWDDDKWADIPEELRPFSPGAPYDCDHGCHQSGATFDSSSTVVVYDENGEEVWRSDLDGESLNEQEVSAEETEELYISEYDEGTVVFFGAQGEKGLFFGNEFELRAPFDPKKLFISYGDYDGWLMVNGVQYDGEDIDGSDYDTSGKWGEAKWLIVGETEEVYEGVERDDDYGNDEDEDNWNPETDGLAALEDAVGELEAKFGSADDDEDDSNTPKGWPN